jgi:CRP-like cAMP-binding protein
LSEKCKYESFKIALEEGAFISEENWARIKSHLIIRHFKKGETIIKEGQIENYLSVIAKGCIRFFVLKNGVEINFEFAFDHNFCTSYASFLSRLPSLVWLEAIEDVTLVSIHYDSLQELYNGSAYGERIGRLTTEGYYIWREKREIHLLSSTPEELYLDLVAQYPEYIHRIPQKHLASYLKVQPESLSRIKRRIHASRKRT